MTETAELLCYRLVGGERDYTAHMRRLHPWAWECNCPRTEECEWRGDERGIATVGGGLVFHLRDVGQYHGSPIGQVIRYGGLKLRVLDMRYESGRAYDSYYVALANNPHGDLQVLYRRTAKWVLRQCVTLEARIRGFMLQPVEGREMKVTAWIAGRLL